MHSFSRYRKKAYWCEWFRHHRYKPLRSQFLSQRSKSVLLRASSSMGFFAPPPSEVATPQSASSDSDCGSQPVPWSSESFQLLGFEGIGEPLAPHSCQNEVLGPDPLSVLCLTQFLKHKDAVQTAYRGDPAVASAFPVQLKTHVDCKNAKSYVHFRWYSDSIIEELRQLGSQTPSDNSLSAIGCINIQHWNKKQPKSPGDLPQSSKELVGLQLKLEKVVSTFQVVPPDQGAITVETTRRPDRSRNYDWKSVDDLIWTAATKMGLLTPEIIRQQQTVPFPSELARSDNSWTTCSCHRFGRNALRAPSTSNTSPVRDPGPTENSAVISGPPKIGSGISDIINVLPQYMRPAYEAMHAWIPKPKESFEFHFSRRSSDFESMDSKKQSMLRGSSCYGHQNIKIEESRLDMCGGFASGDQSFGSPHMDSTLPAHASAPSSEHPSSMENLTFFGTSPLFHCLHVSMDSATFPDLDFKHLIETSPPCPSEPRRVGLFCSIGGHSGDQTHIVTQCISSIQTALDAMMGPSVPLEAKSSLLVFVALSIHGEFHIPDCEARYIFTCSARVECMLWHVSPMMIYFIEQHRPHQPLQAKSFKDETCCWALISLSSLFLYSCVCVSRCQSHFKEVYDVINVSVAARSLNLIAHNYNHQVHREQTFACCKC